MAAPGPSPTPAAADPAARPVTALRGVGPQLARRLERIGVRTVADLLLHRPLRYEDRTRLVPLGALRAGARALAEGEVELAEVRPRPRRQLLVRVSDRTGALTLRFFHFSEAQRRLFRRGARVRLWGEVRPGPAGLEMVHPEVRVLRGAEPPEAALTPVYPATEGLHQAVLRRLAGEALALLGRGAFPELLPERLLQGLGLPPLHEALRLVHRPPAGADAEALAAGTHPAVRRLALEELLAHALSLRRLRRTVRAAGAPALADGALAGRLLETLPFAPTGAQRRVIAEVAADLARPRPMLRLVQGDVGSGKTVVAAAALCRAVGSGWQGALMAPTELLAEQHARSLAGWLEPLGVRVVLLTGGRRRGRAAALRAVASGEADVVVGTHALFQEEVAFARLGLVVIDEQHRFGVHQRLALREKGAGGRLRPHQLVMTATPIPRTLAQVAYADLDSSVLDELPPGRQPVATVAVPESRREEVVERVRAVCRAGRQAYWVCTLIEPSEALAAEAAEETAARLREALPDVAVGLVHGRMRPAEKAGVMRAFAHGELGLLVATTVIEVGVDVPNATVMVIENAERLGLAQLHQLRGRVGRGREAASCVLLYRPPLSETARARLQVLRETTDGFEIARRDLELRGPGELLGTRQTGLLDLRVADLARDRDLVAVVARLADRLLAEAPEAAAALVARWVGERARYAEV